MTALSYKRPKILHVSNAIFDSSHLFYQHRYRRKSLNLVRRKSQRCSRIMRFTDIRPTWSPLPVKLRVVCQLGLRRMSKRRARIGIPFPDKNRKPNAKLILGCGSFGRRSNSAYRRSPGSDKLGDSGNPLATENVGKW